MSFDNDGLNFTIEAAADISGDQYRGVVVTTGGVDAAGADAVIAGVLQNNPSTGQAANVRSKGVSKAQIGAAVAIGATLATDASGDFVTTAVADDIVAIALEAGSGAGSIIAVLLL